VSGIFSLFSDTIIGFAMHISIIQIKIVLKIFPEALNLKPIKIIIILKKDKKYNKL